MPFNIRMIRNLITILLTLVQSTMLAQVSANFSASSTSGCPPLIVNYTNQSTATGGITLAYIWDDGTNYSTLQNPVLGYSQPGTYVITLTAYNANNSSVFDTETLTITVHNKPTVSLSASPSSGCSPLAVQFSSSGSAAGSGTISSYFWDFGDGSTGSGSSPSHTYTSGGTYNPSLKITNSFGCHKTVNMSSNVVVSGGPNASFSSSNNQACAPPLTVNFSSTTTGGVTPYSYNWDLDVSTSTNQNPSATYSSSGFYDIQLIVTDNAGCKDTLVSDDYVVITAVEADFDVESPACMGEPIDIDNNSVGGSQYSWAWGDNTNGGGASPSKSYAAGGTYTITMTATSGNCTDSHTETVQIQEITPSFTSSPNYICEAPYITNYTNTSTVNIGSIASHIWRWGIEHEDPTITSLVDSNQVDSIDRNELYMGYFDDTLIVISDIGCTAKTTVSNNVLLEDFEVLFSISPNRGCAPDSVDFTDLTVPTASYPITSWFYELGNGTTSTLQNPSGIYFQDTGCYESKLIVENSFGCRDSLIKVPPLGICLGNQPVAQAAFTEDSICGSDSAWFYNVPVSTFANEWFWNFSDGTNVGGDTVNVKFVDTGWIDLQYVVGHYGCYDTVDYDSVIYIKGPIVKFSADFDCDTPMVRWFNPYVFNGVTDFYWDFADGSPLDSVNENPVHLYTTSGTYNITLTTENSNYGCSDEYVATYEVRNLSAAFTISNFGQLPVDSTACVPSSMQFNAVTSMDELPKYWWWVNGDTLSSTETDTSYYFTQPGWYEIILATYDANLCRDTASHSVFLSDPQANFSFNYSGGCDPVGVSFNDQSTSDTTVNDWLWYYGDGSSDTSIINPSHYYGSVGTYPVTLLIEDEIGCTDTKTKLVLVKNPFVAFTMDSVICEFSNLNVLNQSLGDSLTYYWNFGNNVTNTIENPGPVLYVNPGQYTVYLAIEDDLGCQDTAFQTLTVKPKPDVNFTSDTSSSPCLPLFVTFIDETIGDDLSTWKWDFGDGTGSVTLDTNLANHTYNTAGSFDVTLTVENIYGCKSSKKKAGFIQVSGPYAEFGIAPDSTCVNDPVSFFVTERLRMAKYTWVYGDGYDTTVAGNVDTVYHAFDRVGTRTPIVVYYDSLEICQIPFFDSIYIHEVKSDFSFTPDSVGCGRLNVQMLNRGLGADFYRWELSNGDVSTAKNPKKYFPKPGEYEVELYVENKDIGCIDSITKLFVVHPIPDVLASADTLICLGDSVDVFGESSIDSLSWYWQPARFVSSDSAKSTKAAPDTTKYLRVYGMDTNQCIGVDSVLITVQDTPRVDLFSDTTVIIGEVVILEPKTDDELYYEWIPPGLLSCDDCAYPTYKAEANQDFYLIARDIYGCFEKKFDFRINVDERYSLDVPDAFSPNGDGVNDVIYARGWGVKELLEFRIYNRWGQEVFSTNSIHVGWDGTYRGKDQGIDTYAYIVKVKRYDDEEAFKEGFIELMR